MLLRRSSWGAALVIAVFIGIVGVRATDAGARSTRAASIPQLTWAIPAAIRGLDYTHSADGNSASVISLGMEPLVRYDKLGRLTPDLASSFSTPNPTTYIYNIRKGVKFWDGKPLTTADVVYSLERSADKKGGSEIASFFTDVKSIKATGAHRVTIKLSKPNPFFKY